MRPWLCGAVVSKIDDDVVNVCPRRESKRSKSPTCGVREYTSHARLHQHDAGTFCYCILHDNRVSSFTVFIANTGYLKCPNATLCKVKIVKHRMDHSGITTCPPCPP